MKKNKGLIIVLLAILIGVLSISGISYYKDMKLENSKVDGDKFLQDGEYDKAIDEYEKVLLEEENNAEWYLKIAEAYIRKGDIQNSNLYLEKITGLENLSGEYSTQVVYMQFINGEIEKALKTGEKALNEYPENKKLQEIMVLIYTSNGLLDKAKDIIYNYDVNEESAEDLAKYSKMLILIEEKDKAYEALEQAWYIDKDEFLIYDVLSQMATYNKDQVLMDIIPLYKEDVTNPIYKMWLAKIYSVNSSTADTALQVAEDLEKEGFESEVLDYIRIASYQFLGEFDKADKIVEEMLKSNEDYSTYHVAAWYYYNREDYETALKYVEKSIELNKEYPDNYAFLLPEIYAKLGTVEKSEEVLLTAIYLEPFNHNIIINYANYCYNLDEREKAIELFNTASTMKPLDTEIKYNMVFLHIKNGNTEEAIRLLEECIKLNETNPIGKYYRTLSTIYMFQGDGETAYKYIREAYSIDQEDILTLNNAGIYHISMSEHEDMEYNINRAWTNISKAYEGLNDTYDDDVVETIIYNYELIKDLYIEYYNGEDNAVLEMPEFILFY